MMNHHIRNGIVTDRLDTDKKYMPAAPGLRSEKVAMLATAALSWKFLCAKTRTRIGCT